MALTPYLCINCFFFSSQLFSSTKLGFVIEEIGDKQSAKKKKTCTLRKWRKEGPNWCHQASRPVFKPLDSVHSTAKRLLGGSLRFF